MQFNSEQTSEPIVDQSRTDDGPIVNTYKNEKNDNKHRRDDFYLSSQQKEIQRIREADDKALQRWLAEED